jgi:hypothetical protein
MDEKEAEIIRQMGVDKPVMSIRHVGSRMEIHLYGEAGPRIVESETGYTPAVLSKKKVSELKALAALLGVKVSGKVKADLIAAIVEREGYDHQLK